MNQMLKEVQFNTCVRGLIATKGSRHPLSLYGCALGVKCKNYTTQVRLQLEYVNETDSNKTVTAAYPLPFGWDLQECSVTYDGHTVQAKYCGDGKEVREHSEACSTLTFTPLPDELVMGVVAQALPFNIQVGTSALMSAVYHIPSCNGYPVLSATRFTLKLCSMLFPVLQRPDDTVVSYGEMFRLINTVRYLRKGVVLDVSAELPVALRGPVRLERVHSSGTGQLITSIPLDCKTEYIGDSAFSLRHTAPLEDLCLCNRPASLLLTCELQNICEPLRIFLEKELSSTVVEEDAVALVACFTPRLRRGLPNVEVVVVCDAHSTQVLTAMAEALRPALGSLPSSTYLNILLLSKDKNFCLYPEGPVCVRDINLHKSLALIASSPPQNPHLGDGVSQLPHILHSLLTYRECFGGRAPLEGYLRHILVLSDEASTEHLPASISMVVEATTAALHHDIRVSAVAITNLTETPTGARVMQTASGIATLRLLSEQGGGSFKVADSPNSLTEAIMQAVAECTVETLTNIQVEIQSNVPVRPGFPIRHNKGNSASLVAAVPYGGQHLFYFLAPAALSSFSMSISGKFGSLVHEYNVNCDCTIATSSEGDGGGALSVGPLHVAAAQSRLRYIASLVTEDPVNAQKEALRLSQSFFVPSLYTLLVSNNASASAMVGTFIVAPQIHYIRFMALRSQFMKDRATTSLELPPNPIHKNVQSIAGMLRKPSSTEDYIRGIVNDIVDLTVSGPRIGELFTLQSPTGAFPLNHLLAVYLGVPFEQLLNARPEACNSEDCWATLVALVAMQKSPTRQCTLLTERAASLFLDSNRSVSGWRNWIPKARELLGLIEGNKDARDFITLS